VGALALVGALAGCGGGGDGGKTLPLGTEATVEYVTPASGDTPAVNTKLGVTVLDVRKGTQQQLTDGGLQVDADAKDATPYYVDAQFADTGSGSLKRNLSVSAEDSDDNSLPTTIVIGLGGKPFTLCPNIDSGTLAPGQSYKACTLFLVPKGSSIAKVRFVSQDAKAKITFSDWRPK
jgi:hypothetical protein